VDNRKKLSIKKVPLNFKIAQPPESLSPHTTPHPKQAENSIITDRKIDRGGYS
jgi:hypothetical protein